MRGLSSALDHALEHGAAVIARSQLLLHHCEVTGMRSRQLAHDFVLAHSMVQLIRGASDRVDGRREPPREVWRHRPTGEVWVVVTQITGAPVSAAGPFAPDDWDPALLDFVPIDGHHSIDWLRQHIHEFTRDDADQS